MNPHHNNPRHQHLQQLLKQRKPLDTTEQEYQQRMMELLQSEGDPFSRHHFVPGHFTASSFVLSPDQTSILLIYHGKLHRWLQPGGHIDPDDVDVVAAARREVLEETGMSDIKLHCSGVFDVDIHEIPPLKSDPAHEHFDVRFLFRADSTNIQAGSDAKDARWTPLTAVNEHESDRSVMRALEKIIAITTKA